MSSSSNTGAGGLSNDTSGVSKPTKTCSQALTKRLQNELMNLSMNPENGVSAFPEGDSLFRWVGTIMGPDDTVFCGLEFKLSLEFPSDYPFKPPKVKFTTPCLHPNVSQNGNICLDILKDKWSAMLDVRTVLISIRSLLGEPNLDSPLNSSAANLWADQKLYRKVMMSDNTTIKRQFREQAESSSP